MSSAAELAALSYEELSKRLTVAEWHGYNWWMHWRRTERPAGDIELGVEVAKCKIARCEEADRKKREGG